MTEPKDNETEELPIVSEGINLTRDEAQMMIFELKLQREDLRKHCKHHDNYQGLTYLFGSLLLWIAYLHFFD
mgnify:CR=1 FL=1